MKKITLSQNLNYKKKLHTNISNSGKKSMGAVIAVSLLMVVAVASVISLQGWFETYSSNIENKVESSSKESVTIYLQYIERDSTNLSLYYYNPSLNYIEIISIKVNSTICPLVNSDVLAQSIVTKIEVVNCTSQIGVKNEITLVTSKGVFSEIYYIK